MEFILRAEIVGGWRRYDSLMIVKSRQEGGSVNDSAIRGGGAGHSGSESKTREDGKNVS